jgi:serine/threonine protein kinase
MSAEIEPVPESEGPHSVGRLLAGKYRLQRVLGEGGMAIVYEGEHVALGKRVAVKLVHSLFVNDPDVVHRFEREARSASAVESEHIVHVFDVGADAELGLFLVMELLKGEDLSTVLARRARLEPMFAAGLVKQASLGLEKAHAAGIIHRDLKPANVFLVERDDGTTLVKLVDFGIAKIVRDAEDARFARKGITRRGTAIGTPQYMSPEQAQALDTVDHRTDVFSLGAVLFEAIAGQPYMPERPTYEQTILQLVSTRPPRLSSIVPDIPPALDDLVADMLEHDLEKRVPSMRTVRERLEGVYPELAGSAVKLRSLPPPSSPSLDRYVVHGSGAPHGVTVSGTSSAAMILPRTRRPLLYVAAFAIAAGAIVGIGATWGSGKGQPLPPAPPAVDTAQAAIPPPPAATSGALAEPRPTAPAPAPSASAAEGTTANAVAPGSAPPQALRKGTAPVHAKDQVGAAGISSQF